jgi:RNA-binding protein YlmH
MNKDEILKRVLMKEDKMLVSSVIDKYIKHDKTGINTYTNFLDPRKQQILSNILKYMKVDYHTYKPSEECEKSIIYFGEYDNFITIYKLDISGIKHSDVLGTLFSIGLDIDTIGDIFVEYKLLSNKIFNLVRFVI